MTAENAVTDTSWMVPGARVRVVDVRGDEYAGQIVEPPPGVYQGGFPKRWLRLDRGRRLAWPPIPWPIEDIRPEPSEATIR